MCVLGLLVAMHLIHSPTHCLIHESKYRQKGYL